MYPLRSSRTWQLELRDQGLQFATYMRCHVFQLSCTAVLYRGSAVNMKGRGKGGLLGRVGHDTIVVVVLLCWNDGGGWGTGGGWSQEQVLWRQGVWMLFLPTFTPLAAVGEDTLSCSMEATQVYYLFLPACFTRFLEMKILELRQASQDLSVVVCLFLLLLLRVSFYISTERNYQGFLKINWHKNILDHVI